MFWDNFTSFEEAEKAWDEGAAKAAQLQPIKSAGFRASTGEEKEHFLQLKSLWWMVVKDKGCTLLRYVICRPWFHLKRYLCALFKKEPHRQEGDFYFFDLFDEEEFKAQARLPDARVVVGFSYCEKPFECPMKWFSPNCIADADNPVCRQCFIGKCRHLLPKRIEVIIIPTVHDVGKALFTAARGSGFENLIERQQAAFRHESPKPDPIAAGTPLLFCITACPLSFRMFAPFGHMAGFKGIGVALQGRTCNSFAAFRIAEGGAKTQRTSISDESKTRLLHLFRTLR